MRFSLLATVLTVMIGAGYAPAQVININLTGGNGPNPDISVNGVPGTQTPLPANGTVFNEVNGSPDFTDLLDSLGGATGIGVTTALNGNSNFNFSQDENLPIIQNYWAGNIGFGGTPAATSNILFTGFDPGSEWDLAFVAQGDTDGQGAVFTIGSTTLTSLGSDANGDLMDSDMNTLTEPFTDGVNFVFFDNVVTSPQGEISIDVSAGPGDEGFIVLNALQLVREGTEIIDACDVNASGICNTSDFEVLRDNLFQFGVETTAARTDGDLDGDGDVDFSDYRIFKDDLIRVIGVDSAATILAGSTIPEPGTQLLAVIGSLLIAARKRAR